MVFGASLKAAPLKQHIEIGRKTAAAMAEEETEGRIRDV
jgi:hypothetical protein